MKNKLSCLSLAVIGFFFASNAMATMSCSTCDEMFDACMSEVDPSYPAVYASCQILWDNCKSTCTADSARSTSLTKKDVESKVIDSYLSAKEKNDAAKKTTVK